MGKLARIIASFTIALYAFQAHAADKFYVFISPSTIGLSPFLKMGQSGTEAAAKKHGAQVKIYESKTVGDRSDNVNAAINEGASIVVLMGYEFNDVVKQIAPTAPDTQFLVVDQCLDDRPANVHCVVFRDYEATYLMGVAAGMLTKTNKVGVIAAVDIPFEHRYTDGYAEGVKSVNPNATVDIRWVGGDNPFADPVRAKEQAVAMNAAGADYIFTASSGGDFGVYEAAKEKNFKALGVDVNLCADYPGLLVDQSLKFADTAIAQAVDALEAGQNFGQLELGLKESAVGAVALDKPNLASSKCLIADHPEVVDKMRAVAASIVDGSLKLQDPMLAK